MLRNTIISIATLAVISLTSPTGAFARGGGGGHGGGGGLHGGGFRAHGLGLFGPYAYGDYSYYSGDGYEGGCYLVMRRVLTRHGWRSRRVEVCD